MRYIALAEQLRVYDPTCTVEQEFKIKILTFMNQYQDCFERSLTVGHITASSWLLNKEHSKVLMMHHTKLNRWFQLGGHCDGNPNTLEVAVKEAREESGIEGIEPLDTRIFDIDIHWIPDNPKEKGHYHYDIRYLLHVVSDEDIKQNRESKELRWIDKNIQALPTDNPSIIRMAQKWFIGNN